VAPARTALLEGTRSGARFDILRQDVRFASRMLRRNVVFTIVATLSLAIGIGANTTIATIANALLFSAPPGVAEPDRLLDIYRAEDGQPMANFTTSYPYYQDVSRRTTTIASMFAFELEPRPITVGSSDGTDPAFAIVVTANYFATLGVEPAAGRLFKVDDDAAPAVVLSYRFWHRRFKLNPHVVGDTLQINRQQFRVVGIASEAFRGTNIVSPDVWVPMGAIDMLQPGTGRLTNRGLLDMGMGGRLAHSASQAEAAAELGVIARDLEREHPNDGPGIRLRCARLSPIPGPLTSVAAVFLALLLALVATTLTIACANVSGVLLARAAARRREMAVRIAIGAGRRRLIRQLLTETALLFALGGGVGLLLAKVLTSLLLALLPAFPVPVDVSLSLDSRVVLFTSALTLLAAFLAGLAPALHASRTDVVVALKDESQGPSDRLRTRSAFVIVQVAFSIALVVVAGLLVQALQRVSKIDLGFDPAGIETTSLDLNAAGYTSGEAELFARDLVTRLRALPDAEAATLSQWAPGRGGTDVRMTVPGVSPPAGEPAFTATWNAVEPGFFHTLRVPLIAGHEFTGAEGAGGEAVAIVSESMARFLWPGEDAVGRYVMWHEPRSGRPETVTSLRIVGVVSDLKSPLTASRRRLVDRQLRAGGVAEVHAAPPMLMMYVSLQQRFASKLTVLVRARGSRRLAADIRAIVKWMNANLPMPTPQPLDTQSGPIYLQLRIAVSVAGSVGIVGLLLAAIGVYGVTAYTAQRRTREIGVRMALGAARRDVVTLVMRQGMTLVGIGATAGLLLAAASSRLFTALFAGVRPLDPLAFGAAAALFGMVGAIASYLPARRATRIDAMEALRYE
jgi:predicted permease